LSGSVLAFTFGLAVVTGVAFGVDSGDHDDAGRCERGAEAGAGPDGRENGGARCARRGGGGVALSLVLLAGAGLMIRSLWNLQSIIRDSTSKRADDVGEGEQESVCQCNGEAQFFNRVLERVSAYRVCSRGGDRQPALTGGSNQPVAVEGQPAMAMSEQPAVSVRVPTRGTSKTMRIPLLEGEM